MVPVVQSVRASDCGSECRGFESHLAPQDNYNRQRLRLEEQNLLTFFIGINFDKQRIGYSKITETTETIEPFW